MVERILTFSFLFLVGCVSFDSTGLTLAEEEKTTTTVSEVTPTAIIQEPIDLWERIRNQLSISIPENYEDAEIYKKRFLNNQHAINRMINASQRYLFHTVNKAEELNLPVELALLPFVESEFDPYAQSIYGATGIWQFLPATGREWGLKSNWWYDGKRDIVASTDAALTFLTYLYRRFDNDWLLAMAAYNAGPSRINRAIKKNKEEGKPTDFWSLKLPKETTAYVPKLLVLCELIKDPSSYGVVLPSIANRQYFVKVTIPGQVDLLQAADLAGMTPEAIYELNPGFNQWATDPGGPHYLLLPAGISDRFLIKLSSLSEVELVQWDRYQIKRGDNLSKIAKNYSIEVAVLKEINQLEDDLIYAGKEIMVPRGPAWVKTFVPRSKTYQVVKGDTFWGISKQFGVSIQDLTLWNDLNLRKPLQIGQKIKIFSRYESVRGKTPNKKTKTLLYPVKVGDTLSRIGSRFGIKAADIQKWNELKSPQLIYPGQVLKIILNNGVGN